VFAGSFTILIFLLQINARHYTYKIMTTVKLAKFCEENVHLILKSIFVGVSHHHPDPHTTTLYPQDSALDLRPHADPLLKWFCLAGSFQRLRYSQVEVLLLSSLEVWSLSPARPGCVKPKMLR
jgi:hypothetical protein